MLILIGVATFINIAIVLRKLVTDRIADACIDGGVFIFTCYVFAGSFSALAVGTVASALFSTYLIFNPICTKMVKKKQKTK